MYNLDNTYNIQVLQAGKQKDLAYKLLKFEMLLNLQQNTHIEFRNQENIVPLNRLFKNFIHNFEEHRCLLQKKHVTILYLKNQNIDEIKEDLKYIFKKEERKLKKMTMPRMYVKKTLNGLAAKTLTSLNIGFISIENNYIVFFNTLYALEFRYFLLDYKPHYFFSDAEINMRKYVYKEIENTDEQYQLVKE